MFTPSLYPFFLPPFLVQPPCRLREEPISLSCPCTDTQVRGRVVCSLSSSAALMLTSREFSLRKMK